MMKQAIFLLWLGAALPAAAPVWAQEQSETRVWVQIEARPTEAEADERARAYAEVFPDVAGYRLSSGWYAIVLGPYGTDVARLRLQDLLEAGMIPRDSFIADGRAFREPFLAPGELPPAPDAEALAVPGPEMLPEDEPLDAPPALEAAPAPCRTRPPPRRGGPRRFSSPPSGRSCRPPCNGSASTARPSTGPSARAPAPRWRPGRRPRAPRPPAS